MVKGQIIFVVTKLSNGAMWSVYRVLEDLPDVYKVETAIGTTDWIVKKAHKTISKRMDEAITSLKECITEKITDFPILDITKAVNANLEEKMFTPTGEGGVYYAKNESTNEDDGE